MVHDVIPEAAGPVPLPSVLARARTVLVVEDDRLVRELIAEVLEAEGYRVLATAEAEAALALVVAEGIDLLFTDIDLPGRLDGIALARAARARRPSLPVLYASGGRRGLGTRDAVAGSAFLPKPYRPTEVCRLVDRLLR